VAAGGEPVPPPYAVKSRVVSRYASAFGATTFIETGTYFGDMVWAMRNHFNFIVFIELSEDLWKRAVGRFRAYQHIQIRLGDSGKLLPGILENISSTCLFWLDGHYFGEGTARGCSEAPIVAELKTVFAHPVKDHVILIDDARCFDGTHGYPTLDELQKLVALNRPDYVFSVLNDVIRIYPQRVVQSKL
jgi:hypothetical protein